MERKTYLLNAVLAGALSLMHPQPVAGQEQGEGGSTPPHWEGEDLVKWLDRDRLLRVTRSCESGSKFLVVHFTRFGLNRNESDKIIVVNRETLREQELVINYAPGSLYEDSSAVAVLGLDSYDFLIVGQRGRRTRAATFTGSCPSSPPVAEDDFIPLG